METVIVISRVYYGHENDNTFTIALQTVKNLSLLKYFKTTNYIIFDIFLTVLEAEVPFCVQNQQCTKW